MKKALLYGYLNNNLGDDLLIGTIVDRYPNVRFFISSEAGASKYLDEKSNLVISFRAKVITKMIGAESRIESKGKKIPGAMWITKILANKFCAGIYIAGSVFVQAGKKWQGAVRRQINRINVTPRYYILGANFGPYTDDNYRIEFEQCFKDAVDVCFRDTFSVSCFDEDNIRYAPDVVFGHDFSQYGLTVIDNKKIFFSVIWCKRPGRNHGVRAVEDIYEDKMACLASMFMKKGYEVNFISFCDGQGDNCAAERIAEKCRKEGFTNCNVVSYRGNMKEILQLLAESEYVFATRFHAMILGWIFGKKTLPICYDDKMRHVVDDVGIEHYLDILKLADVEENDLSKLIEDIQIISCNELIRESQNHFLLLDEELS